MMQCDAAVSSGREPAVVHGLQLTPNNRGEGRLTLSESTHGNLDVDGGSFGGRPTATRQGMEWYDDSGWNHGRWSYVHDQVGGRGRDAAAMLTRTMWVGALSHRTPSSRKQATAGAATECIILSQRRARGESDDAVGAAAAAVTTWATHTHRAPSGRFVSRPYSATRPSRPPVIPVTPAQLSRPHSNERASAFLASRGSPASKACSSIPRRPEGRAHRPVQASVLPTESAADDPAAPRHAACSRVRRRVADTTRLR